MHQRCLHLLLRKREHGGGHRKRREPANSNPLRTSAVAKGNCSQFAYNSVAHSGAPLFLLRILGALCVTIPPLTTLRPPHLRLLQLPPERCIRRTRGSDASSFEKPCICRLIKNFAKSRQESIPAGNDSLHPRSSANRVRTNGDSFTLTSLAPLRIPHHCRADSISTSVTITISIPVTAASSRLLKISREVAPDAGPAAKIFACARNPTLGSASNILCHDAVNVTETSHASGTSVTAAYFARCILIMIVVATHRATIASSWLAIPNSGHNELIPPSGSFTPCQRKYPHAPTISALVARIDGYQLVLPSGLYTCASASCTMKRATRVPASSTVNMKSASNISAK